MLSSSLLIPASVLAVLAWAVPVGLSWVMPEGVRALMILAFLSAILLFCVSAAFFFCLYLWGGAPFGELAAVGFWANVVFFGRLGLMSALIWAPIMVLSVASRPRRWVKETW